MDNLLATFTMITLDEMSGIRLMNRVDTKFITTMPVLYRLLGMARNEYMAQEVGGDRNPYYSTTYYDTRDMDMFYHHQYGHANRQKLRFRVYHGSDLQFMEVKTKNNHGRTKKKRMRVDDMSLNDADKLGFLALNLRYDPQSLEPALSNRFQRMTLVNKARTERLTIDTNLSFHNIRTGNDMHMGQLVIVELKRDSLSQSPVLGMLRELRIFPHGFSKYCMGSALTNPQLRINRFKPRLHDVNKLLSNI